MTNYSSDQARHWNFYYFITIQKEGLTILIREIFALIQEKCHILRGRLSGTQDHNRIENEIESQEDQPTAILYSAHIISRIVAVVLFWVPSFVLDIRHGTQPSRVFVSFSYLISIFIVIVGSYLGYLLVEPTMKIILPGLIVRVFNLISMLVTAAIFGFYSYGSFNLAYFIYHRHFFKRFFLYHANILRLPKSYQRRTACCLFFTGFCLAFCSEPLFVILTLIQNIRQPNYWPHLDGGSFSFVKTVVIFLTATATLLASLVCNLVANLTRFLILVTSKHLEVYFNNQLRRFNRQTSFAGEYGHNKQLVGLADELTLETMADYSCETLTMDWPVLDTRDEEDDHRQQRQQNEHLITIRHHVPPSCSTGSSVGSLLFVYKNLIKNFSELKVMIEEYQGKFGYFHLVTICLSGLIVAQWVVAALTQARLIGKDTRGHSGAILASFGDIHVTHFALRAGIGVVIFLVTNIHVFLSCDCIRSRICMVESQLFKESINLAISTIRSQSLGAYRQKGTNMTQKWSEIDNIWSLYDQCVRIGHKANFRLTPNTYYHKNCLLMILGREVSFVLLYIQIIDIYSNL